MYKRKEIKKYIGFPLMLFKMAQEFNLITQKIK